MILSISQQGLFLARNPFQTDNISSRHWRMSVIFLESHVSPPNRYVLVQKQHFLFISRFQLSGNCHLSIPYALIKSYRSLDSHSEGSRIHPQIRVRLSCIPLRIIPRFQANSLDGACEPMCKNIIRLKYRTVEFNLLYHCGNYDDSGKMYDVAGFYTLTAQDTSLKTIKEKIFTIHSRMNNQTQQLG